METLFTVAEVADYFQVTERTVRNWIKAGTLRAIRAGGTVRIRRSDVERLVGSTK